MEALVKACKEGDLGTLTQHITREHMNQANSLGGPLLNIAIRNHRVNVVRLLLEQGADPEAGHLDNPPLHCAIRERQLEMVELLLHHGADVNRRGSTGWTGLLLASAGGNLEITGLLLAHGASVQRTRLNCTAFEYAAEYANNYQLCELLLVRGVSRDLNPCTCMSPQLYSLLGQTISLQRMCQWTVWVSSFTQGVPHEVAGV